MEYPTLTELRSWPATVGVVRAGQALGMGRNGSYESVRAGTFPVRTLRIGHRVRVVTAELIALLEAAQPDQEVA